jgi:hypothetical protein
MMTSARADFSVASGAPDDDTPQKKAGQMPGFFYRAQLTIVFRA